MWEIVFYGSAVLKWMRWVDVYIYLAFDAVLVSFGASLWYVTSRFRVFSKRGWKRSYLLVLRWGPGILGNITLRGRSFACTWRTHDHTMGLLYVCHADEKRLMKLYVWQNTAVDVEFVFLAQSWFVIVRKIPPFFLIETHNEQFFSLYIGCWREWNSLFLTGSLWKLQFLEWVLDTATTLRGMASSACTSTIGIYPAKDFDLCVYCEHHMFYSYLWWVWNVSSTQSVITGWWLSMGQLMMSFGWRRYVEQNWEYTTYGRMSMFRGIINCGTGREWFWQLAGRVVSEYYLQPLFFSYR